MARRLAPAALLATTLVLAACSGAASVTPAPATPAPTAAPATPSPTQAPASPNPSDAGGGTGSVAGGGTEPVLSIEPGEDDAIRATLEDPAAKAWRLTVAGTGELDGDRWVITVDTGDVGPSITATEYVDGEEVDTMDLAGYLDGTAAAGGCHSRLPVCLDSSGFRLPADGDGTFAVTLHLPDAGTPLLVTGATATWDGEPFLLGPWTETEPFPWPAG